MSHDSGGIQEEDSGWGKPVLIMRDTTERSATYEAMSKAVNPYGDGLACERIVNSFE